MKAWRFHEFGSLDNLRLDEISSPEPGPGEVLLRVEFAALNPADAYLIIGKYPRAGTPPMSVGRDGCAIVEVPRVGGRFKKGDRVVILRSDIGVGRDGTLAQCIAAPEDCLAPLPEGWTSEEGAAAPLVFLTAWQALVEKGGVEAGQTVLVTGASGGVGTAAVTLGKAFNARVIALSRSAEKRDRLRALGADIVLDSSDPDLEQRAKDALHGGRVDLVVENLGGPFLQTSINLARERGRILVVGLLAGLTAEIILGTIIFKQIRIEGVQVGAYTPQGAQAVWSKIVRKLDEVRARPLIDQVFPLREVREAFAYLAAGAMGKVLVDMRGQ
ncbi:MAG: NADPH:quinone oxidoreductase family protein [Candidatus Hydrogenedentes bacterium]|nr:NADPH:quinone oxidoreductase family protein [Candidatus Hydrogenedentota bacterium]